MRATDIPEATPCLLQEIRSSHTPLQRPHKLQRLGPRCPSRGGGADRYVMAVALSRRAPSLTLPALIEHCLFVLPRASSGIRESEGLLGGEPGRRKGGARDRERDGGEKMARKGGKS